MNMPTLSQLYANYHKCLVRVIEGEKKSTPQANYKWRHSEAVQNLPAGCTQGNKSMDGIGSSKVTGSRESDILCSGLS